MTHPRYVSTTAYAEAAGISERTVRERIARGEIRATRKTPNAPYRIPWSEYKRVAPDEVELTGRARPRKQRALMALVRGVWTFVLPGIGFLLTWAVDNVVGLGVFSLPVALAIGALAYSLKRYWFPDTIV